MDRGSRPPCTGATEAPICDSSLPSILEVTGGLVSQTSTLHKVLGLCSVSAYLPHERRFQPRAPEPGAAGVSRAPRLSSCYAVLLPSAIGSVTARGVQHAMRPDSPNPFSLKQSSLGPEI
jgi:hypothetical protein